MEDYSMLEAVTKYCSKAVTLLLLLLLLLLADEIGEWKRVHNEELHSLYRSPKNIQGD